MKIAKDGYPYIIGVIIGGTILKRFSKILGWLAYFFAAFCVYFFRDPQRETPQDDNKIISPADGSIVSIEECEENEYIKGPVLKIAIFMSVLNVHVNRAPIEGTVSFVKYRPGNFEAAFNPQASFDNEMNMVGFEGKKTKLLVKQIAGVLARRIVCDVAVGDLIGQGDRFGMIKFGSRLEVFIPKNDKIKVNVELMQNVTSGETVLAEFVD